jgi:hypothetical protein
MTVQGHAPPSSGPPIIGLRGSRECTNHCLSPGITMLDISWSNPAAHLLDSSFAADGVCNGFVRHGVADEHVMRHIGERYRVEPTSTLGCATKAQRTSGWKFHRQVSVQLGSYPGDEGGQPRLSKPRRQKVHEVHRAILRAVTRVNPEQASKVRDVDADSALTGGMTHDLRRHVLTGTLHTGGPSLPDIARRRWICGVVEAYSAWCDGARTPIIGTVVEGEGPRTRIPSTTRPPQYGRSSIADYVPEPA